MSFVVTLTAFAPPPRADGIPFTHALIEEAVGAAGPFSQIDNISLSPPDADPLQPVARVLTTAKAAVEGGWYRVVWRDNEGVVTSPTSPVRHVVEGTEGARPTVAEVAALLRARTKVKGGNEAGTFTSSTRPTSDQVESLIDFALDDVLGKVRTPEAGSTYEGRVRGAVALYAAVLVETSYFPEQVGAGGKSASDTLMKLYESRIKALIAEGETGEPQGEGGQDDTPADPYWSFPVTSTLGRW